VLLRTLRALGGVGQALGNVSFALTTELSKPRDDEPEPAVTSGRTEIDAAAEGHYRTRNWTRWLYWLSVARQQGGTSEFSPGHDKLVLLVAARPGRDDNPALCLAQGRSRQTKDQSAIQPPDDRAHLAASRQVSALVRKTGERT
jgi:hypothetical protein